MNPIRTHVFDERVNYLSQSQYYSRKQHEVEQVKKLQYLINYVKENIPFYQSFLRKEKLDWPDFTKVEHVKRFPLIDKKLIQQDIDLFLPFGSNKNKLFHRTTGGSTGTPLTVYADLDAYARDKANTQHYMHVFGLDIFKYKSIRLYGDKIDEDLIKNEIYWRLEEERKLIMSCYHVTKKTVSAYVNKIDEFNPVYIHTRPSSIYPLANYMLSENILLKKPIRYIFCDGEYITSYQRKIIEQAFQAHLCNIYGHTEACIVGHPCPHSDALHYMPQVGITELLDSDGNEVTTVGQKGQLVATGFNNLIFPLIRYQTNDIAVLGEQSCICGRNYKMISHVEGRVQDYVVDKNGNLVPLAPAIFNYNDMNWKGIKEFKVIQREKGKLIIQILPENDILEREAFGSYIKNSIELIFGITFKISIAFVDSLDKTKIGKYRYLDQKLDIEKYMLI